MSSGLTSHKGILTITRAYFNNKDWTTFNLLSLLEMRILCSTFVCCMGVQAPSPFLSGLNSLCSTVFTKLYIPFDRHGRTLMKICMTIMCYIIIYIFTHLCLVKSLLLANPFSQQVQGKRPLCCLSCASTVLLFLKCFMQKLQQYVFSVFSV